MIEEDYHTIRCLVVGTGSIGQRHISNLLDLGARVGIFTTGVGTRKVLDSRVEFMTSKWVEVSSFAPHLVIVANPTALHVSTIRQCLHDDVIILVEKPLANEMADVAQLIEHFPQAVTNIAVAYNYRFHRAITFCRKALEENLIGPVRYVKCQVGQYLPDWHPDEDYRLSYVARADLGGGVLRTLSHEVDYVDYLLGQEIDELTCMTSRVSDLDIDVEDTANVLVRYESVVAEIHLDMVRRLPVRRLEIYGDNGYLQWNDMKNRIKLYTAEKEEIVWQSQENERNNSFVEELKAILVSVKNKRIDVRFGHPLRAMEILSHCLVSAEKGKSIRLKGGADVHTQ